MSQDLNSYLRQKQAAFGSRLEKNLSEKGRRIDLQRVFEQTVHSRFPKLSILWLKKQQGLLKILLDTYPAPILQQMITTYVNGEWHRTQGISISNFYHYAQAIALLVTEDNTKQQTIAARKEVSEAPPVSDGEIETFKQSAFFKRMPESMRNKLNASKDKVSGEQH